jgi:hypothetical protein
MRLEQRQIDAAIGLREKRLLAVVPPLGDVVRFADSWYNRLPKVKP